MLRTAIGLVAAFCASLSYLPQVIKCWKTGETEDLSLGMLVLLTTGLSLWIAYGVLKGDWVIIGANVVIKSPPDGYNLLLVWDGPIVATPVLFKRPDYEPLKQLTPIGQVTTQGYAVMVHPSVPVKNITELIAYIKKKNAEKEPFGFATSSAGAADHLSGELFRSMAGVDLLTVNHFGTRSEGAHV